MKKIISYFICILTIFLISNQEVEAGSVSLYASSTYVTVGNTVIVTVSAPDVAGNFSITSSNTNVLSGGSSSEWIEGTVTFSFYANNPGSATIRLTPIDAADYSGNEFGESRTINITVAALRVIELSDNNNLASLGIEGANISPEFNSDTLEYTAMLEAGTDKINITASPDDDSASIDGIGEKDVVEGDNEFNITVTAENGASKTYKLKVTVKEYNPVTIKVSNKDYTVVRNKKNLTIPENYEEKTIKIGNEEVPACVGKITKYTLVSLKDSNGKQDWYVKEKDKYTLYKEYKFGSTKLYIMELNEIPSGYEKTTIEYNKEKITAYKNNPDSPYALIYGMNVETGKKNIYMYEEKEGSVQIYNSEFISNKDVSDVSDIYLKLLLATSILLIISGVVIIILKVKKSH